MFSRLVFLPASILWMSAPGIGALRDILNIFNVTETLLFERPESVWGIFSPWLLNTSLSWEKDFVSAGDTALLWSLDFFRLDSQNTLTMVWVTQYCSNWFFFHLSYLLAAFLGTDLNAVSDLLKTPCSLLEPGHKYPWAQWNASPAILQIVSTAINSFRCMRSPTCLFTK